MDIKEFVFNPFYENTYVLYQNSKAVIVDPGCYEQYEFAEITSFIEAEGLEPTLIVNTHCHIDHVLGNYYLKEHYKVPLWIPEGEKEMLEAVKAYAPNWGIMGYTPAAPERYLREGEKIPVGNQELLSILAPGHSPGHLVFHLPAEKILIGGDVIFRDSIGRTDLPGGNHELLLESIREKIYSLPDDTMIYSGHGPMTTVEHEKKNNPFVQA